MSDVLFVDDDATMLRALERSLRRGSQGWRGSYVTSGAAALAHCEREHVDVIMSDIGMPGMDGMALLAQIRARFPAITRIVLSGEARAEERSRAVATVHRWIAKPSPLAKVVETITRVAEARALLGDGGPGAIAAVCGVTCLPTPPETAARLALALEADARLDELVAIVETDLAWTAKLMQVANSAFFGVSECVTSAAAAARVLGLDRVRDLLGSAELRRIDARAAPLVARARHIASAARAFAAPEVAESAAVAALLLEVGELIEGGGEVVARARLGGALLGTWGLPPAIVTAVAFAHDPDAAPDPTDPVLRAVSAARASVGTAPVLQSALRGSVWSA